MEQYKPLVEALVMLSFTVGLSKYEYKDLVRRRPGQSMLGKVCRLSLTIMLGFTTILSILGV